MKKIISILLICSCVLSVSGCERANKLFERVKLNIEDIADDFSTNTASDTSEMTPETENSINLSVIALDTFNPLTTKSDTVKETMQLVFDSLFEVDPSMHITPLLASGYSISPDGLTYNITMKHDVLWHDGKTFDAYDVAYTISQIMNGVTTYSEYVKDIADYRAVSDDVLKITLKRPVPQFASLLCFPIVKYGADMTAAYKPIGTGAFKYYGKIRIDKYQLDAYDLYHNGRPKIDTVYIYTVPDKEKYGSMFDVSETDIVTSRSIDLTTYMPKGKSRVNDFVSDKLTFLGFNFKNKILSGNNTRCAIAQLINKDELVNTVIYSRGVPTDILINPYSWLYYDTNTDFSGSHEKAMELFGNDSWGMNEDGQLQRKNNSKRELLKLMLLVNSDDETSVNVGKKLKADMEKCGIKITMDEEKEQRYLQKISSGDYDLFVGSYDFGINQDVTPLVQAAGNYFSYSNANVDMLISQLGMTQDENSMKEISKQLCELLKNDMPLVPLYYSKESVLTSSKIKNGIQPSISNYFRVSNVWSVKE